jgi:chemotaxis protein methyltransferase CheR
MSTVDLEVIELDLLLEGLFRRYGYDFRSYARASLERRVNNFLPTCKCANISELIPKVLRDEKLFSKLAQNLSITVTEFFRDPFVFKVMTDKVIPLLKTWPHVKIWHAGCATGEEVYSLAILLQEAGLYDRATIYATDFNDSALAKAQAGIFELGQMKDATRSYQEAGGSGSFGDYYHARYDSAILSAGLKKNVTFANHNLAVDGVFGEMHLIICRNVLIYFDRDLQNRALSLFSDSLVHGGFLCIGTKESLQFTSVAKDFQDLDQRARIYKRINGK